MERRAVNGRVELETREAGDPAIRGVAAVYYREGDTATEYRLWENCVERIMPGAFDRAAVEDDVRGLFNHDPNQVLGRSKSGTLSLELRDDGIHYRLEPSDTSVYRDVAEHLRRGDVDGSSFAFRVTDERWRDQDGLEVREILGVELFDVGPVTYPAYAGTDAGYRSARESRELWIAERERRERNRLDDLEAFKRQVDNAEYWGVDFLKK